MRRTGCKVASAVVVVLGGVTLSLGAFAGVGWAVSSGGFQSSQNDCTLNADAEGTPNGVTQPGCHTGEVNVEDGNGNRYAELGINQMPLGAPTGTPGLLSLGYPGNTNSPHAGCLSVNTNETGGGTGTGCGNNASGLGFATAFDYYSVFCPIVAAAGRPCSDTSYARSTPFTLDTGTPDVSALVKNVATSGLMGYFGLFDNVDAGEHDGVDGSPYQTCTSETCTNPYVSGKCAGQACNPNETAGSFNGPSDGGASIIALTPKQLSHIPTLMDPLPALPLDAGSCADGNCEELTTDQQVVYQGCSPADDQASDVACSPSRADSTRNVADYANKQWDPYNCASSDAATEDPGPAGCGAKGMDYYRQTEAHNVVVDPGVTVYEDPDPQGSPAGLYPDPGIYVGTCGVIIGGGQDVPKLSTKLPLVNAAGQLDIPLGC